MTLLYSYIFAIIGRVVENGAAFGIYDNSESGDRFLNLLRYRYYLA